MNREQRRHPQHPLMPMFEKDEKKSLKHERIKSDSKAKGKIEKKFTMQNFS